MGRGRRHTCVGLRLQRLRPVVQEQRRVPKPVKANPKSTALHRTPYGSTVVGVRRAVALGVVVRWSVVGMVRLYVKSGVSCARSGGLPDSMLQMQCECGWPLWL